MVSIDRFQLAVIERWSAYTVASIDRFQLSVIEVACLYSGVYRQVSAGCNREVTYLYST